MPPLWLRTSLGKRNTISARVVLFCARVKKVAEGEGRGEKMARRVLRVRACACVYVKNEGEGGDRSEDM